MAYVVDPALLTQSGLVRVATRTTSGEVEPVLIRHRRRWFLGVGSDHTDREIEQVDVPASKAACMKPLADRVMPLPLDVETGGYDEEWDAIEVSLRSGEQRYQSGQLAALQPPSRLINFALTEAPNISVDDDLVIFGGTLPLLSDAAAPTAEWDMRMWLPGGLLISHRYTLAVLEVEDATR
jgi:4-hydroxyphenylacetate 3-monooxygenase